LLEKKSKKLCDGLQKNVHELEISAQFTRVGSMFSMFFTDQTIKNFDSVKTCDTEFFKRYFNALLEEGVYIAPSQFEVGFMSAIHSDEEIDQTIAVSLKALKIASS
jgi:glutamate-1-semialdehyde 2,1-aminomutase